MIKQEAEARLNKLLELHELVTLLRPARETPNKQAIYNQYRAVLHQVLGAMLAPKPIVVPQGPLAVDHAPPDRPQEGNATARRTFMDRLLAGEVTPDVADDEVNRWRTLPRFGRGPGQPGACPPLREWLGMTREQYEAFVAGDWPTFNRLVDEMKGEP